ncbi:signal transduction histidine kinase [Streptomyces sp. SLBN-118]|uniref:ATP-binding protein n=1 Tax=Streptomyces sp. SLBN-118 TaxID=2768454 RepID=UPI001174A9AA|nr:ATP-binding protein [Streptomyces sp. SLBN-118]TQK49811.1 signal transduction histidine kinase [Streptomyces sp. SLBN-118]
MLSLPVAAVGVVLSVVLCVFLVRQAHDASQQFVDRRADLIAERVTAETRRYEDALRQVTATAAVLDPLTREEFLASTTPLRRMELPGVGSVAFVVAAGDGEVAAVQERWRSRGATDLTLRPRKTGREHLFAVFVQQLGTTPSRSRGLDGSQIPQFVDALARAKATGSVTLSATYQLLADRNLPAARRQNSFVLAAPVHQPAGSGRAGPLLGWVTMGLRGQNFTGAALRHTAQGTVDVALYARDTRERLVRVAGLRAASAGARDVHAQRTVRVVNREWVLRVAAPAEAVPGGSVLGPTVITAAAVVLTGLLAVLVYVLATGRARARRQVQQATAELRTTEARARRHAELLEAVMDNISDGVSVIDETGEFLLHNPAADRLLGIGQAHGGSQTWHGHYGVFLPGGSDPFPTEQLPLVRALAGDSTDQVEMVIRNAGRPDGVHITVSARPMAGADGSPGAVAVFHDITAQKTQEAELKSFAGVVAHDLKSPLTAIGGYTEILQDELAGQHAAPDGPVQWALERVITTTGRMRQLIHDLLDHATAGSRPLHTEDVDLTELVQAVAAARIEQHRAADASPAPQITVDPLPAVHADAAMVRQLIDNLIGNAIKYTAPGTRPHLTVSGQQAGSGQASIEIADNGIGIPAGQHEAIFNSFYRAHTGTEYSGTGLGLSICRRVIERHGGIIAAGDNPGGGTRFSFTLPLPVDHHAHPDPPQAGR